MAFGAAVGSYVVGVGRFCHEKASSSRFRFDPVGLAGVSGHLLCAQADGRYRYPVHWTLLLFAAIALEQIRRYLAIAQRADQDRMKVAAPTAMIATPSSVHSTTEALPTPTPLQSLAFYCFWVFNLANSAASWTLSPTSLHIPLILGATATLGAVLGGGVGRTIRSTIGMSMTALTVLYAANVPFSSWRGGSLSTFTGSWLKSALVFLIAGSVVMTLRHCRWALYSIAMGAALAAVLIDWKGTMVDGRLALTQGSYSNPNEIALGLVLGLPCLGLMFVDSRAGKFRKLLIGAAILATLVVLLRTGSRGGLISLVVVGFCVFWRVSLPGRVLMVLAMVVLAAMAEALLPGELQGATRPSSRTPRLPATISSRRRTPRFCEAQSAPPVRGRRCSCEV